MTKPIVRFAPSPTGNIHIGNTRTALLNYCFAKARGGTFILRFDDTDMERSRREYADGIEVDLAWLGVKPDRIERQSDCMDRYAEAAQKLKAAGLLYPCFETQEELERKRKRQMARGLPPVYDRAALKLTAEEKAALEAEGKKPHWRLKMSDNTVSWNDGVRGPQAIDLKSLSDPVMVRADGTYLYTFTSVVDDMDMGITHIIRGEDHVTNTAAQLDLFAALKAERLPEFAHHNLLTTADGTGLSKRLGHLSLKALRETGIDPMAVASLAVLIGSAEAVKAYTSLEELAEHVDLAKLSRAPAKFDMNELEALSTKLLHEKPFDAVAEKLEHIGISGAKAEAFWLLIRGNLNALSDAKDYWSIITGDLPQATADVEFLAQAADLLPLEPWDTSTWKTWTETLKTSSGRKGKELFMPLRLALTGMDHGPEMASLLPLLDPSQVLERLKA
jgi:glutamyl-tRNA synthetase